MDNLNTLDDLIEYSSIYSEHNYSLYADIDGFKVIDENIVSRYSRYVQAYTSEFNTDKQSRDTYKYRPDLLSAKLYGTPDLAWLIMMINSVDSPSRFILHSKIKLIKVDNLKELFLILATKNRNELNSNHLEHSL